jgi:radical SAM superfamily enzyme YgiQ (UPF0313 family)
VDLVVRGEAEETFPAVLSAIEGDTGFDAILGITYRVKGQIVRARNAPVIKNLDALPIPAYHLYADVEKCSNIPLELGRGCPFACSFCSTNDFFRRNFRLKSPQKMLAQMRELKKRYGVSAFDLVHDMFTIDRKRVVSFCRELVESGEMFRWGCSARTDCIDEELIAEMAEAGCRGIFFGIETGSVRMQRSVNKKLIWKKRCE